MQRVHFRTCHLCEAMCGVRIDLSGSTITRISGDPADVFSRGHICPKGVALQDLHTDPDRLRYPVVREGDRWQRVSWETAFDIAADGLRRVQASHGRDAVAVYQGNPNVHNYGNVMFGLPLARALKTKNRMSATSVDQLPHHVAAYHCLGHPLLLPIPDVDRTDLLVMFGANPFASNGSLMSAGNIRARLQAIQDRGGAVIVVDPRRTATAEAASAHYAIRPGTDAWLLASLVHAVFADPDWTPPTTPISGLAALKDAVAPFSPARTEAKTGIAATSVWSLARRLVRTEKAVVYGRMGVSTQAFGTTCQWLLLALNTITGHLDREGGAMFTSPAIDLVRGVLGMGLPGSHGRWKSRVRGIEEFSGELPVVVLAEEIETPGTGQVRGLLTIAGNPVLSTPDGTRLEAAISGLDFYVAVDHYINETTRHANVILPPASPLTRDHYDIIFHALAVRNTTKWSPPMEQRPVDERHDWEILAALEERLQSKQSWKARLQRAALRHLGPSGILDIALRVGPRGGVRGLSLETLKRHPHGIDLGPLRPRLSEALATASRTVELAPPRFLADVPRLNDELDTAPPPGGLQLIGRRDLRSNNSWLHNSTRLVKGRPRCTLLVHPEDAQARAFSTGDLVTITSGVGEITVLAKISDEMRPGVVCLPHGWGHHRPGVGWRVAAVHAGASYNDLVPTDQIDPVSGNAVLNGGWVEVRRAPRPQTTEPDAEPTTTPRQAHPA